MYCTFDGDGNYCFYYTAWINLSLQVPVSFYSPGEYNITVVASNALSSSTVTAVTTLQEAILSVTASIAPVAIGSSSTLEITIEGGSSLQLDIDFGDGSTLHIPHLEEAVALSEISITRLTPVMAIYFLPKIYEALGEYHCTVKASNLVSEFTVSSVTQVEEGITGLQLTSASHHILRTGEEVVFVATVDSGNDVVFHWDFGGIGHLQVEK